MGVYLSSSYKLTIVYIVERIGVFIIELFLTEDKKIDFKCINNNETLESYLESIEKLIASNPINCSQCTESCCKKSWNIIVDVPFMQRVANNEKEKIIELFNSKLKCDMLDEDIETARIKFDKKLNCPFIDENNICTIYEQRPLTCKVFVCFGDSKKHSFFKLMIRSFMTTLAVKMYFDYVKNEELSDLVFEVDYKDVIKYNDLKLNYILEWYCDNYNMNEDELELFNDIIRNDVIS
ncbi:MAG: YkgJ family cysteine cluster protein [Clostridium sp.]|uniref:YkgJ family cysteine cluster protein n=1 Tax=Clostridium sp. TaxID=1506 RepID=UPI00306D279D